MQKRINQLFVTVTTLTFLFSTSGFAQKSSSSSRPSSSSSRPSSSSSRPSSSSSRPSSSSSRPSKSSSGPMFGGSKTTNKSPTTTNKGSMFGGNKQTTTHERPIITTGNQTSLRPTNSNVSSKAQAQRREESRQAYIITQRATAPAKTETVIRGKTVKVDVASPVVTRLRSRPSTYIQPAIRKERVVSRVNVYHYQHPADYYYRPVNYGIGPFDNGFWWMMMEWNAERRANWLYHNQARLSAEAYADARRDAAVQQRLSALEAQRTPINANYVDPEFADEPTDMYDQNYVEAAYNPSMMPVVSKGPSIWMIVVWVGIIVGVGLIIFGIFSARYGD